MWTVQYWKDFGERSMATFAAALSGAFTVSAVGIPQIGWKQALEFAAATTAATMLKCLAAAYRRSPATASLLE